MLMSIEEVTKFVVDLFRRLHPGREIDAKTSLGENLDSDKNIRLLYYYAILIELEDKGYTVYMLTPEVCAQASTLQDIIDNIIAEKREGIVEKEIEAM